MWLVQRLPQAGPRIAWPRQVARWLPALPALLFLVVFSSVLLPFVAGMALVMRYVAGGRYELGAAAPTDAGRLLGAGMTLAVACAVVPLLFGLPPLTSWFWETEIPVIGHIEFVTSTLFDIGVYLVVIGLVLDVLRSLGGEVDRQTQELRERGVTVS